MWSPGPDLPPGMERTLALGLTTSASGFIATGVFNGTGMNDLWEISETVGTDDISDNQVSVYFDGSAITVNKTSNDNLIELYNIKGQKTGSWKNTNRVVPGNLANGVYIVYLAEKQQVKVTKKIYFYK